MSVYQQIVVYRKPQGAACANTCIHPDIPMNWKEMYGFQSVCKRFMICVISFIQSQISQMFSERKGLSLKCSILLLLCCVICHLMFTYHLELNTKSTLYINCMKIGGVTN